MSSVHQSKLIDDLYSASDEREAEQILEEIDNVLDPIFIHPLFSAYKRFKDSSISHYFISSLNRIQTKEVLDVMIKIISDTDTDPLIFTYALKTLLKYEYFKTEIVSKAESILVDFYLHETNINLENLLEYLEKNGSIAKSSITLLSIFQSNKFNKNDRITSLNYLLVSSPKKWLKFYIDNYSQIKNKKSENILSEIILGWKGPLVEKLKDKIIKDGGYRAKEIIEESFKKEIKESSKKEDKELKSHPNSKIIAEIVGLREKINILTETEPMIGFRLFPSHELIYKQLEAANTEDNFKSVCMRLRDFFQDIDKSVSGHGLSLNEARNVILGLLENDFNKSINQLHLFLYSKGMNIASDLYGLRTINKLVNLFTHTNATNDLIDLLKKMSGWKYYQEEDWINLHRFILKYYLDFLTKFHSQLINFINEPRV